MEPKAKRPKARRFFKTHGLLISLDVIGGLRRLHKPIEARDGKRILTHVLYPLPGALTITHLWLTEEEANRSTKLYEGW